MTRHFWLPSWPSDKSTVYKEYTKYLSFYFSYVQIQTWRVSDSNMGNWMFVYSEIWALSGGGGRSQLEHLSVLGLDQNINKLSLDQRIGQMSRDMQRSQRTDRHMSGLKRQKVGQRDTAQYVFFLFLSSAGWMVFLSFVQKWTCAAFCFVAETSLLQHL